MSIDGLVITGGKCVECYSNNHCTPPNDSCDENRKCVPGKTFKRFATRRMGQAEVQSRVDDTANKINDAQNAAPETRADMR